MKFTILTLVSFFVLILTLFKVQAAVPTWQVNASAYEFSMTVTAVLNTEGRISTNENDLVAAFINGECRGVAHPGTYLTPEGHAMVFLQVYSNTIIGENVTFQLYNADDDKVYDAVNVESFQNDLNLGSAAKPLVITNNHKPTDITFSALVVKENLPVGSFVGKLSSSDPDASDTFLYSLVSGDGDTDNSKFFIRNDSLFTSQALSFTDNNSLSILVMTDDQKGETFIKTLTINIVPDENLFVAGNYISPNGDGINDTWEIANNYLYADYDVSIFSAGGQVIFQSKGYSKSWDGTYNSSKVPTGVYYYLVQNNSSKFTGIITLVNE